MASRFLLLLLVSAAAAELGFRPKQQCSYDYEAKQASGIPGLKTQWSAFGLKMNVNIQVPTAGNLYVQFKDIKHAELHNEKVPLPWRNPIDFPWRPVQQFEQFLGKVFKVEMQNGKVHAIITSRDEPVWIVNIKKSVAQLFQLDLQQQQTMEVPQAAWPQSYQSAKTGSAAHFFRVMEEGIGGECETLYETTSPLPVNMKADILEELRQRPAVHVPQMDEFQPFIVTKTKNYQNCRKRPLWQHMTPPALECRADDCHLTASNRSATVRYLLDGDLSSFRIQSVIAEKETLVFPYGHMTEQLWSLTNQTLFLKNCQRMGTFVGEPTQPKTERTLEFVYPTADDQELRFPDLKSAPQMSTVLPGVPVKLIKQQMPVTQLIQRVQELIRKVDHYLNQVAEVDVLGYYIEIEKALSWMSYDELKQVYQGMQTQAQKDIFTDVLAMTGTNPAITLIFDYLQQEVIGDKRAATIIATLPMYIKTPTPELLTKMFQMFKAAPIQTKQNLRITMALSLGNLLHQVCVGNTTVGFSYTYGQGLYPKMTFCTPEMKSLMIQEVIPYLEQMVDKYEQPEKLVYIQALGNIGHKAILPILHKLFATPTGFPLVETQAVYALYRVNKPYPEETRKLVSPIFHDVTRDHRTRVAAFTITLATNPPIAYWQKIAASTWFEPNEVVVAFVHSTVDNLANITMAHIPPLFEMSRRAKASLALMRPPQGGFAYSGTFHAENAHVINKYQVAAMSALSIITSPWSIVPSTFYKENRQYINSEVYGTSRLAVHVQGAQRLINELFSRPTEERRSPRDFNIGSQVYNRIVSALKLRDLPVAPEFQATAYTQLMGAIDAFFLVNTTRYEEMLEFIQRGGSYNGNQAQKVVYLEDKTVTIPSEIGINMVYSKKVPLVASVRGQMSASWSYQQGTYAAHLQKVQPFVAFKSRVLIGTVSPFSLRVLGVGVENNAQVSLPMTMKLKLDTNAKKLQVLTEMIQMPPQVKVAHIRTIPFTTAVKVNDYVQLTASPDTKEIHVCDKNWWDIPYGKPFGIKGTVRLMAECSNMNFGSFWYEFIRRRETGQTTFWYLMSTLRPRRYEVIVDAGASASQKFEITLTYTRPEDNEIPMREPIIQNPQHIQKVSYAIRTLKELIQQTVQKVPVAETKIGYTAVASITQRGGQQLHYNAFFTFATDAGWYTQAVKFQGETVNSKVCLDTHLVFPWLSDRRQTLLQSEITMPVTAKLGFGSTCQEHVIDLKGKVQRDQLAKQYAQSCPQARRCQTHERQGNPNSHDCRIAKDHAALANYYDLEFNFRNLPLYFRNASYGLDYFAKYLFWPYMTNNPYQQNTENKVHIRMQIKPANNTFTMHVQKPFETTKFEEVYLPFNVAYGPFVPTLRKSLMMKAIDSMYGVDKTVCIADTQVLKTFDNLTMTRKPNAECWTLMTMDASKLLKIAILEKQVNGMPAVRIIVDDKDIEIHAANFKVWVNGQVKPIQRQQPIRVRCSDGRHDIAYILMLADDTVKVILPKHFTKLKVTKESVQVKMWQSVYRNKLTGICGNMDAEHRDDMLGPQRCLFKREQDLFRAFVVPLENSQQCQPRLPNPSTCLRLPLTYVPLSREPYAPRPQAGYY